MEWSLCVTKKAGFFVQCLYCNGRGKCSLSSVQLERTNPKSLTDFAKRSYPCC